MTRRNVRPASSAIRCAALLASVAALFLSGSARADLVIMADNVTATAGDTGIGLDVTLTNTGPGSIDIGGFSFELTVGSTDIKFTDVTTGTTTSPYIFGTLGLNGPDIGLLVTNQDIMASDVYSVIGAGTTLASGETYGLGHLLFDVSNSASGVYDIVITPFPATSLSDFNFNDVPITTLVNGSVSVRGVPEPASLGLVGMGVFVAGAVARRRRTRKHTNAAN